MSDTLIYYTYILFDWRGVPRYVGMGKGDRWLVHERETDRINFLKNEFIERAFTMLGEVPKIKVCEGMTRDDAAALEIALIAAIGREPNGPLVNMIDGLLSRKMRTTKGYKYITNGLQSRVLHPGTALPTGWRFGIAPHKIVKGILCSERNKKGWITRRNKQV